MGYKQLTLLLAICLFVLTGCFGYKDIDKRFFVVEIGIDKAKQEDKKYSVTIKLAIAGGDMKKAGSESLVLTEEGKTISEAIRELKAKIDKEMDFGHTKMIVIGEGMANEGIADMLDWFIRRRDLQQISYIGIGKPTATAILDTKPKFERIPGNYLFLVFGDTGTETPFVTTNYLFNVRRGLTEYGLDPVLPIIEKNKETLAVDHAGIFKEDKLAMIMSKEETMFFNAIDKEYPKVELQIDKGESTFGVSSKVLSFEYKIDTTNEVPTIHANLEIEGILVESNEQVEEETLIQYEELVKKYVEEKTLDLLSKFQEKGIDPLGFGLRYRATHYGKEEEKWETWQSIYPDITFEINTNVILKGTGIIE